jgi:hypothetical protein
MFRRQITFDEKVDARFTRRGRGDCWWWEGSLHEGRPAINLRGVMRYLYEREVAPIPPGMVLVRTDHRLECRRMTEACPHMRCVNPFHVVPRPGRSGLYEREVSHDITSSERSAERKRRVRANRRDKERRDDD